MMTNTPTSVQRGATVFSLGQWATEEDGQFVHKMFSTVGMSEMLPETYLGKFSKKYASLQRTLNKNVGH